MKKVSLNDKRSGSIYYIGSFCLCLCSRLYRYMYLRRVCEIYSAIYPVQKDNFKQNYSHKEISRNERNEQGIRV